MCSLFCFVSPFLFLSLSLSLSLSLACSFSPGLESGTAVSNLGLVLLFLHRIGISRSLGLKGKIFCSVANTTARAWCRCCHFTTPALQVRELELQAGLSGPKKPYQILINPDKPQTHPGSSSLTPGLSVGLYPQPGVVPMASLRGVRGLQLEGLEGLGVCCVLVSGLQGLWGFPG